MGQQSRSGEAALDRTARRRRLHDAIATRAAELRANMADHLETGRNILHNLGDIFAELLQRAVAIGAGWFRGAWVLVSRGR